MKKLLLKPYVSAVIILLVSAVLSGRILGSNIAPVFMVLAATAVIISINISSILFYLSFNSERKVGRVLFSILNLLVFLLVGVFAVEILGHSMIK